MKMGPTRLLVLTLLLLMSSAFIEVRTAEDPQVLVQCPPPPNNLECLTFGFTYPGPGSLLEVEGLAMKNGYILWAETINNSTEGISTK